MLSSRSSRPDDVSSMSEIDENVTFVLPKALREDR